MYRPITFCEVLITPTQKLGLNAPLQLNMQIAGLLILTISGKEEHFQSAAFASI